MAYSENDDGVRVLREKANTPVANATAETEFRVP